MAFVAEGRPLIGAATISFSEVEGLIHLRSPGFLNQYYSTEIKDGTHDDHELHNCVVLRSGDSGARTAGKSVRPKGVTYVLRTLCNPCLRAGPLESVVRPGGLELPTFWFVARRSIQLSYGRAVCLRGKQFTAVVLFVQQQR
jgi:hypothetical protein